MDEKFISWNLDIEATKRMLSDLYKNPVTALFRELIANALSATHIANGNTPVKVYVEDEKSIIITDNGIGMTPEEFKEHFMCFGNSLNAKHNGIVGQFGIGAKVILSLIGETGYATLTTRSRKTGQALKAKLTLNGATFETIENPEDIPFGTTIAIHLPKPIQEYLPGNNNTFENFCKWLLRELKDLFRYTRYPITVQTPFYTEEITQPSDLRLIEKTDEYELYLDVERLNEMSPSWVSNRYHDTIIVIADLKVAEVSYTGKPYVIRLLKENGTLKLAPDIEVEIPTPHLSRDYYTAPREFAELLIAKARLNRAYNILKDLTDPLKAREIDKNRFKDAVKDVYKYLKDSNIKLRKLAEAIIETAYGFRRINGDRAAGQIAGNQPRNRHAQSHQRKR
jgi:hypothetical protein